MDASNVSSSNGVMVALLPEMAEWSNMEFPHLTLVYAGSKEEISLAQFNQMAKDAASLAMISRPLGLRVLGVDIFGEPLERVKVLRLQVVLVVALLSLYCYYFSRICNTNALQSASIRLKFEDANARL